MIKTTKEEFDITGPYYCSCHDHEEILWKPHYKYTGIPKYITHHNFKYKTQKKGFTIHCNCCKKPIYIKKCHYKKNKAYYCSIECKSKTKTELENKVIDLYLSMLTFKDIKEKLNISLNRIWKICKNAGVSRLTGTIKGTKFTKEHCNNISLSITKKFNTDYYSNLFSNQSKGIKKTFETCQKISQHRKGKLLSEEHKKSISKSGREYYKNGGKVPPVKRAEYISKDGEIILMRSSWELEFAKYLDSINELWFYEFWAFDLGDTIYTPDFYLPRRELFIEIKGRWREPGKTKFNRFLEEYCFENIMLIQQPPPYSNIILQ